MTVLLVTSSASNNDEVSLATGTAVRHLPADDFGEDNPTDFGRYDHGTIHLSVMAHSLRMGPALELVRFASLSTIGSGHSLYAGKPS